MHTNSYSYLLLLALPLFNCILALDQYNYQGCYDASALESSITLTSKGSYLYQSVSYCQEQCSNSNVVALLNGNECFCGDSISFIYSLEKLSSSKCDTACGGWPYQTCGGSSAMDVYIDASVSISSQEQSSQISSSTLKTSSSIKASSETQLATKSSISSSSLSSFTTRITLTPSSAKVAALSSSTKSSSRPISVSSSSLIASPTSSTVPLSSSTKQDITTSSTQTPTVSTTTAIQTAISLQQLSSSDLANVPTSTTSPKAAVTSIHYTTKVVVQSVLTTLNQEATTVIVTSTSIMSSYSTATALSAGANSSMNGKSSTGNSNKLSGGAIAGIVIGVVIGFLMILLILVLIFMYWRKQKKKNMMEKSQVDFEENKQFQPYSFGDEDANPIILPEQSSKTSSWIFSNNNAANISNATKRNSGTQSLQSSKGSKTNSLFGRGSTANVPPPTILEKMSYPSTVFEEPGIYANDQDKNIFSATSLPDLGMDNGVLHIVNPDTPDEISTVDFETDLVNDKAANESF
ncbi:hypothetical protein KAFR_0C01500 [Kazachstania africana CBS 2517]|uniref:WSC domain-containing protein n=1 Tax=Kazachstania africana (strain ATCC 22294 / BCRC 22015 / CBS 2517 / CECT 1963 / NBRC 1671 / NRRL Y-8276) TaxID=1071382 RepID=H2ARZ3_KAZAF|nr:hypothetical protein KAFR_0C01500 [Kazachstania africana CBS 2517]CCF57143.1 hypothetical protein KAFR_0C01500 [Kazachstania africana CBS 2517]